jgi:hypothetical protein
MPPDAYVKEEAPPLPPGAFFKEDGEIGPLLPGGGATLRTFAMLGGGGV